MPEQTGSLEENQKQLDISDKVMEIIDDPEGPPRTVRLQDLLRSLKNEPALTVILDWRGEFGARWAKAFLEESDAIRKGQKRSIAIRCTEKEKNLVRNVFASGVKWINSKE